LPLPISEADGLLVLGDGSLVVPEPNMPCVVPAVPGAPAGLLAVLVAFEPVAGALVEAVPVEALPLADVPYDDVPVEAVPLGALPYDDVPVDAVPLCEVPYDGEPVDAVPVEDVPVIRWNVFDVRSRMFCMLVRMRSRAWAHEARASAASSCAAIDGTVAASGFRACRFAHESP